MKRRTAILLLVIVTALSFKIVYAQQSGEPELHFVKAYGDLEYSKYKSKPLALTFVAKNLPYNFNESSKNNVQFENENIVLSDCNIQCIDVQYKNYKFYEILMDYSILEDSEPEKSCFEVNNIILNDKTYDIGTLYFFPSSDGKENHAESFGLSCGGGLRSGIKLESFNEKFYNFSNEEVQIAQINLHHFSDMIQKLKVKNKTYPLEEPHAIVPISPHGEAEINIVFNDTYVAGNYYIFYFTPTITYTKEDNTQCTVDGNYFVSGLSLSKWDFITILRDMNLIENPYIL